MFMEVDDKVKIAYYWFSKEENFLSGTEDLIQNTTELLLHNRDVMARERARKRSKDLGR